MWWCFWRRRKKKKTPKRLARYWVEQASRIGGRGAGDCKHSTQRISTRMREEGWSHFICHGWYKEEPHRWIQTIDGSIVDGVQILINPSFYKMRKMRFIRGNTRRSHE